MAYHVYISNSGSEWFSHFLMDENTGILEPQADIELEGAPSVHMNYSWAWAPGSGLAREAFSCYHR